VLVDVEPSESVVDGLTCPGLLFIPPSPPPVDVIVEKIEFEPNPFT
jgi:hypothetical protein